MPVVDCPDHACAALRLELGVFCYGCCREVVETPLGAATREPPVGLVAEAKTQFESNRTVAAFAIEARATALGMIEEVTDAS